jgi:F-type H+-transporting ATPase subunit c
MSTQQSTLTRFFLVKLTVLIYLFQTKSNKRRIAFMETLVVGLAALGPGIGIGMIGAAFANSVARQPEVQGKITPILFAFAAMVELLGLFGFLAFIMNKGG